MQAMLDELSKTVDQDAHAVVIMDRAGWHCAKALIVPDNLSLAFLPSYSPELNVIERVWLYLKERDLSLRIWPDYDDILDAVCDAWNKLIDEPRKIKPLTGADWLVSVKTQWGRYNLPSCLAVDDGIGSEKKIQTCPPLPDRDRSRAASIW